MDSKSSKLMEHVQTWSATAYDDYHGRTIKRDSVSSYAARRIFDIEHIVSRILRSKGQLFPIKNSKTNRTQSNLTNSVINIDNESAKYIEPTNLGHEVLNVLASDLLLISMHFGTHELNPYVALFIRCSSDRCLFDPIPFPRNIVELTGIADTLNGLVESIRTEANSAKFKAIVKKFERLSQKNYAALNAYINDWFEECEKILVLRLECVYRPEFARTNGMQLTYEEAKKHRETFVAMMHSRVTPFENLLGYALKLEYGLDTGYQYRVLVLMDGSKVREEIAMAQQIGESWVASTGGKGLYYNCNEYIYPPCGIGMVDRNDPEKRDALKVASFFMTKFDSLIKFVPPGKDPTFFIGE
jgi:hypothetical protein